MSEIDNDVVNAARALHENGLIPDDLLMEFEALEEMSRLGQDEAEEHNPQPQDKEKWDD